MFILVTVRERLYNLLEVSDFDRTIFSRDLRNFAIYRIDLRKDPSEAWIEILWTRQTREKAHTMAQIFFPVTSSFRALNSSDNGFRVSFISPIYTCTSSAEYSAGIPSFNAVRSCVSRRRHAEQTHSAQPPRISSTALVQDPLLDNGVI